MMSLQGSDVRVLNGVGVVLGKEGAVPRLPLAHQRRRRESRHLQAKIKAADPCESGPDHPRAV